MPKYEVRLRSQTDEQSRLVTLSADNEDEAKAICVMAERERVAYTFDADADISDEDAERAERALRFDDAGKVVLVGGADAADKRLRARFHMHHQAKPYVVAGLEVVQIDVDRLVRELAGLKHDEKAWQQILDALRDEGTATAAVTAALFGVPMKNQYDGTAVVDWDTDTIKAALLTGYSLGQDTHDFFDDVSATEISGTTDAVVYKSTGSAATSPLMAAVDFGATVSTTAGTFQITWDATGIVVLDVT